MNIVPLSAFSDNYIWAIVPENSQNMICVDPGDSAPVLQYLKEKQLTLGAIILTHHHSDHIAGVPKLKELFPDVRVYGPDDPRIPGVNNPVSDCNTFELLNLNWEVIATPGHTSTHISFYVANQGWLFCGDTLFSAGCGRVLDGTIEELHHTLERLKRLPDTTKIFCAHEYTLQNLRFAKQVEPQNQAVLDYLSFLSKQPKGFCSLPSTLALEKNINPFLRTDMPDVRQYAQNRGADNTNTLAVFEKLRADKNIFT